MAAAYDGVQHRALKSLQLFFFSTVQMYIRSLVYIWRAVRKWSLPRLQQGSVWLGSSRSSLATERCRQDSHRTRVQRHDSASTQIPGILKLCTTRSAYGKTQKIPRGGKTSFQQCVEFRGEANFKRIVVSLIFVRWLYHIECCTLKHVHIRRQEHSRRGP